MKGLVVSNDPLTYLAKLKNKKDEQPANTEIGFIQSMLCSMVAGGAASVLTNPLDMGKLRL